jgi:hypothetical protein
VQSCRYLRLQYQWPKDWYVTTPCRLYSDTIPWTNVDSEKDQVLQEGKLPAPYLAGSTR